MLVRIRMKSRFPTKSPAHPGVFIHNRFDLAMNSFWIRRLLYQIRGPISDLVMSGFRNVPAVPTTFASGIKEARGSFHGPRIIIFGDNYTPAPFDAGVLYKHQASRLDEALTLGALPSKFASAAHSFGLLASLLFRWLLEIGARLHFTEQAFALHLLFQGA